MRFCSIQLCCVFSFTSRSVNRHYCATCVLACCRMEQWRPVVDNTDAGVERRICSTLNRHGDRIFKDENVTAMMMKMRKKMHMRERNDSWECCLPLKQDLCLKEMCFIV